MSNTGLSPLSPPQIHKMKTMWVLPDNLLKLLPSLLSLSKASTITTHHRLEISPNASKTSCMTSISTQTWSRYEHGTRTSSLTWPTSRSSHATRQDWCSSKSFRDSQK
jgi:hypothetical protein